MKPLLIITAAIAAYLIHAAHAANVQTSTVPRDAILAAANATHIPPAIIAGLCCGEDGKFANASPSDIMSGARVLRSELRRNGNDLFRALVVFTGSEARADRVLTRARSYLPLFNRVRVQRAEPAAPKARKPTPEDMARHSARHRHPLPTEGTYRRHPLPRWLPLGCRQLITKTPPKPDKKANIMKVNPISIILAALALALISALTSCGTTSMVVHQYPQSGYSGGALATDYQQEAVKASYRPQAVPVSMPAAKPEADPMNSYREFYYE